MTQHHQIRTIQYLRNGASSKPDNNKRRKPKLNRVCECEECVRAEKSLHTDTPEPLEGDTT